MKTTEEWDEEYERNIHVDLPGRRRVGEPYREHIRQLETENDRLREALDAICDMPERDQDDQYRLRAIARAAIAQGGQDD
jgi:hypothetical protein